MLKILSNCHSLYHEPYYSCESNFQLGILKINHIYNKTYNENCLNPPVMRSKDNNVLKDTCYYYQWYDDRYILVYFYDQNYPSTYMTLNVCSDIINLISEYDTQFIYSDKYDINVNGPKLLHIYIIIIGNGSVLSLFILNNSEYFNINDDNICNVKNTIIMVNVIGDVLLIITNDIFSNLGVVISAFVGTYICICILFVTFIICVCDCH